MTQKILQRKKSLFLLLLSISITFCLVSCSNDEKSILNAEKDTVYDEEYMAKEIAVYQIHQQTYANDETVYDIKITDSDGNGRYIVTATTKPGAFETWWAVFVEIYDDNDHYRVVANYHGDGITQEQWIETYKTDGNYNWGDAKAKATEPTNSSSETTSPEDTQTPTENDAHYAKYIGDALVVVDDKAHIWEESTIASILANAKAMSELSGYSIMIVVTNDMFDMTSQEFADDYFDYALTSNEGDTELITDGYLFLINLADREYYLSTCGEAIDVYSDTVMDELFNEIQQFMVDGDYESAVNKVIEKTIYEEKLLLNNIIYSSTSNTGMEFDCTLDDFVKNYNALAEEYWEDAAPLWTINRSEFELTDDSGDNTIIYTYFDYVSGKNVSQVSLYINKTNGNIIQLSYFLNEQMYDSMEERAKNNYTRILISFYCSALGFDKNTVYDNYWMKLFETEDINGVLQLHEDNTTFNFTVLNTGWMAFNCVATTQT